MGSVTRVEQPKLTSLRTINTPRYNQPSKYTSAWEPYVALNLHMYAVPLAIFLRRARELDFSADKFERSIEIVMRVFRVFSSEVVDAISRHLESRQSSPVPPLVLTHQETLGPFAPPVGVLALTSLKADMQSLLEEIDAQHSKRVRELDTFGWFVGKFEGFFGQGVVSGEEKKLEGLMDRAKIIARLPVEYNLLPRKGPSATAKHANDQDTNSIQDSTKNGELTDSGRALLLTGAIKSNLADVRYRGDRMRARVGLYEFKFLVDFSVWASDALNERLGLGDKTFRINLRFVADRRNFFPIILTFYFTMIALRNFW